MMAISAMNLDSQKLHYSDQLVPIVVDTKAGSNNKHSGGQRHRNSRSAERIGSSRGSEGRPRETHSSNRHVSRTNLKERRSHRSSKIIDEKALYSSEDHSLPRTSGAKSQHNSKRDKSARKDLTAKPPAPEDIFARAVRSITKQDEERRNRRSRSPGPLRNNSTAGKLRGQGRNPRSVSPGNDALIGSEHHPEKSSSAGKYKSRASSPGKFRGRSPGKYRGCSPGKYRGCSPGKYQTPKVEETAARRARSSSRERILSLLESPRQRQKNTRKSIYDKPCKDILVVQTEHTPRKRSWRTSHNPRQSSVERELLTPGGPCRDFDSSTFDWEDDDQFWVEQAPSCIREDKGSTIRTQSKAFLEDGMLDGVHGESGTKKTSCRTSTVRRRSKSHESSITKNEESMGTTAILNVNSTRASRAHFEMLAKQNHQDFYF